MRPAQDQHQWDAYRVCIVTSKNRNSLRTHVSRAHRSNAKKPPPGAAKRKVLPASTSMRQEKPPRANRRCSISPAEEAKAEAQGQLSDALRVQHAYRLGSKAGKRKLTAAQAEVTFLERTNELLESKLRAPVRDIAYRTSLLAKARDERDDEGPHFVFRRSV